MFLESRWRGCRTYSAYATYPALNSERVGLSSFGASSSGESYTRITLLCFCSCKRAIEVCGLQLATVDLLNFLLHVFLYLLYFLILHLLNTTKRCLPFTNNKFYGQSVTLNFIIVSE